MTLTYISYETFELDGIPLPIENSLSSGIYLTAEWDGRLLNGNSAAANEVVIMINYFNGAQVLEEVPAQIPRTVSGLRGTAEGLFLELEDGGEISPDKVTRLTVAAPDES